MPEVAAGGSCGGGEVVEGSGDLDACLDRRVVGGEEPAGARPGDRRVLVMLVGSAVPGWQQAGGHVEPVVGGGLPDSVAVFGGDAGDGVGGVVDGAKHDGDVSTSGGEAGGVAGEGVASASWGPVRVASGQ